MGHRDKILSNYVNLTCNMCLFRDAHLIITSEDLWCKTFTLNIKSIYLELSWPAAQTVSSSVCRYFVKELIQHKTGREAGADFFFPAAPVSSIVQNIHRCKVSIERDMNPCGIQQRQNDWSQPPCWSFQKSKESTSVATALKSPRDWFTQSNNVLNLLSISSEVSLFYFTFSFKLSYSKHKCVLLWEMIHSM